MRRRAVCICLDKELVEN